MIAAILVIPGPRVRAAGEQNSIPGTEVTNISGVGLTAGPTQSVSLETRVAIQRIGAAAVGMQWLAGE